MIATYRSPAAGEKIRRSQFETILRTALLLEEYKFARQAALAWLAQYPGDLPVNLLYAQSLVKAGLYDQAVSILERICQNDPENLEAVDSLVYALTLQQLGRPSEGKKTPTALAFSQEVLRERIGWLLALGGSPNVMRDAGLVHSYLRGKSAASWSSSLAKSRKALEQNDFDSAEAEIQTVLGADPNCPLVVATHLKILLSRLASNGSRSHMIRSLAAFYRQRWPECILCTLSLAEAMMDSGEPDHAVALLHEAVTKDITGEVARRLWGDDHPYRSLWPADMEYELDIPIPASVSTALGWNALPESIDLGEQTQPVPVGRESVKETARILVEKLDNPSSTEQESQQSETLRSVQAELERISARLNRPGLVQTDGRFPVYVLLTTRKGMEKRFGAQSSTVVESEMLRLVNAVQQRQEWGALLFYADDAVCIRSNKNNQLRLDRKPARADDPWAIKLALLDLDNALRKRGERIGAVLIVGGPEVVPFHHLPNPVDDGDADVASDNPYGTTDENYFIPEWPVGRLPDGGGMKSADPQALLYSLSGLTARHLSLAQNSTPIPWYRRWFRRFASWFRNRTHLPSYIRPSFGYTAAVWKQASINVFRPIGEPGSMQISPPESSASSTRVSGNGSVLPSARLGYFNLHGLEDAPEWYGQRESGGGLPGIIGDGEDYPVAVRPADVMNSGRTPQVVFSEACYGAHIIKKTTEEALALKFLQAGTSAVVGSTCISYGAISPPLIAADFLGHAFWSYLRDGLPAGEALRRAKISLAREMHTRQGYLDGEDQKTLISFVLYGDPLALPEGLEFSAKKFQRPARPPANIKTVCDLAHEEATHKPLPPEILDYVKSVVEQYLPGMAGSELTLSYEHVDCEALQPKHASGFPGNIDSQAVDHLTAHQPYQLARKVVTLSKEIPNSTRLHHHYARLTLDAQGKLVKLAVSR